MANGHPNHPVIAEASCQMHRVTPERRFYPGYPGYHTQQGNLDLYVICLYCRGTECTCGAVNYVDEITLQYPGIRANNVQVMYAQQVYQAFPGNSQFKDPKDWYVDGKKLAGEDGKTYTLTLDRRNNELYWLDEEGNALGATF